MINLLPKSEQKKLKRAFAYKRLFLISIFFLIALFALSLFLFLVNRFVIFSLNKVQKELDQARKEFIGFPLKELEREIGLINKQLREFSTKRERQVLFSKFLEKLTPFVPSSINFSSIFGKRLDKDRLRVKASGFAKNRETLFLFKETLEKEKSFENIYFDLSSWLKPKDINFSFSLEFKRDVKD